MGDCIFKNITNERVNTVAKKWNISHKDAYELILNFESRQTIPVLPIVVNPMFSLEETNHLIKKEESDNKRNFFSLLIKCLCCR